MNTDILDYYKFLYYAGWVFVMGKVGQIVNNDIQD